MNIAHNEALLTLDMDIRKRPVITRLRADARKNLTLARVPLGRE
jgi:hypothetical protein